MTDIPAKLFLNKRKEPRNSYSGLISYIYKKNLYPGKLINYSLSGLFIEADNFFVEGDIEIINKKGELSGKMIEDVECNYWVNR